MKKSSFDHRPLRDLGDALRGALEPVDNDAFVERVMHEARVWDGRGVDDDGWSVLNAWARPVLAAAAAVMVLVAVAVLSTRLLVVERRLTIDDALSATEEVEPTLLMASPIPPDVDVVLAANFER